MLAVARAIAFASAGVGMLGALLAQGGRFNPWLDLSSHLAPFWLGAALLGGLWAAAAEWGVPRRILLLMASIGVLGSGALILPELLRPAPLPAPDGYRYGLRLIQLNTWGALSDPTPMADWIADEKPDMVTVEDVTEPLRQALVRRGFHYTKGIVAGMAIFSRQRPVRSQIQIPGPAWHVLPVFARATFASPDGGSPFSVLAVHLARPAESDRWPARGALADLVVRYPRDRLIVAGDFNLTPWSFALRDFDHRFGLERRDRAVPTWPAVWPLGRELIALPPVLPIDHVYAGPGWRTASVSRGPRLGSDHFPLVVDLALADTTPALPATSAGR